MTSTENLWQRYLRLPRAGQWAVAAAVGIALFMAWNDYVLTWAAALNDQADKLLADAREAAGGERRARRLNGLRNVIQGLGPVERPGSESQADDLALNDAVNEVLKAHRVSEDSFNYRGPEKLKRGTLSQILRPGQRVERITGDLRFDASPEEAIAIIAELEASPTIEAVSDVRLAVLAGRQRVRVDLTVESWIESSESRTRRGGGA
ncbi:MAG: hypothetical protein ACYTBR_13205, partial [Planctomycetota bacterium]|jgi:hypothetical protein